MKRLLWMMFVLAGCQLAVAQTPAASAPAARGLKSVAPSAAQACAEKASLELVFKRGAQRLSAQEQAKLQRWMRYALATGPRTTQVAIQQYAYAASKEKGKALAELRGQYLQALVRQQVQEGVSIGVLTWGLTEKKLDDMPYTDVAYVDAIFDVDCGKGSD